jgi:hypothetical protein
MAAQSTGLYSEYFACYVSFHCLLQAEASLTRIDSSTNLYNHKYSEGNLTTHPFVQITILGSPFKVYDHSGYRVLTRLTVPGRIPSCRESLTSDQTVVGSFPNSYAFKCSIFFWWVSVVAHRSRAEKNNQRLLSSSTSPFGNIDRSHQGGSFQPRSSLVYLCLEFKVELEKLTFTMLGPWKSQDYKVACWHQPSYSSLCGRETRARKRKNCVCSPVSLHPLCSREIPPSASPPSQPYINLVIPKDLTSKVCLM